MPSSAFFNAGNVRIEVTEDQVMVTVIHEDSVPSATNRMMREMTRFVKQLNALRIPYTPRQWRPSDRTKIMTDTVSFKIDRTAK